MEYANVAPPPADAQRTAWWQSALLGMLLVLAGLFVLWDAMAATVVSAIVFGIALLCVGLAEVVAAFRVPHWSGVLWRLLVGSLYAIGGGVLLADPQGASTVLTLAFAAALIVSGGVRLYMAVRNWQRLGWLLLASGIVGIVGGLAILLKWPLSGLWVFGLAVGADLLLHGAWWIASGWTARDEPQPAQLPEGTAS
jgi:uncharacterized membrane protein HdeD (DUF308 family)